MNSSINNIEAVARDICSRQLSRHGSSGAELATDVDRFWHCVAAELEAGQVDDTGNLIAGPDLGQRLEGYRDWYRRHPESKPV